MRRNLLLSVSLLAAFFTSEAIAQGWPAQYGGVMLQGFYWDSYADTQWSYLERQADDIAPYFDLIWIPQSGYSGSSNNMGYTPQYYFNQNSSFGTEGQLRSMIKTYNELGTGFIADVVINHRNNLGVNSSWVDYPAEEYNGQTYQMHSTDIVKNDDGGNTLTWATNNGYSLSDNNDTGEGWDGCRDLDHKSSNVNTIVKAYLGYLLNDLGYAGFRYDMVKGYSASFTADYNTSAKPTYSVGENWSGSTIIKNWIDGTKVDGVPTSAAFDFQFRYRVRDAFSANTFSTLAGSTSDQAGYPLCYQTDYRQYAVTFVENHDTEYRSATSQQDPFKGDTVAANAYMLAMPGTPCVFYKHWLSHKKELKLLISARKQAGVQNTSVSTELQSNASCYVVSTEGSNGTLICAVGYAASSYGCPSGYTEILSGSRYCYYLEDKAVGDWADIVARIEAEEAPKSFTAYDATVYVKADFTPLYFYVWDSNNNTQLNGAWPGKRVDNDESFKVTIDGETWYKQTVNIGADGYYFNIIFNQGSGKPQTTDISRITSDCYFVAKLGTSSVAYEDVTSQYSTGIASVVEDVDNGGLTGRSDACFDLLGRPVKDKIKGFSLQRGRRILIR